MSAATARPATHHDLPVLVDLYEALVAEMVALKPVWEIADGLPVPVADAFRAHLDDLGDFVVMGSYHDVPVGFLVWREDDLLPQADGATVATIRLIFTEPGARRVGVGEAMMADFFDTAASRGIRLFDAVVPPGHRHAKNFFESNGFKARRIVMHRDDRNT